jgi:hypothetical protein
MLTCFYTCTYTYTEPERDLDLKGSRWVMMRNVRHIDPSFQFRTRGNDGDRHILTEHHHSPCQTPCLVLGCISTVTYRGCRCALSTRREEGEYPCYIQPTCGDVSLSLMISLSCVDGSNGRSPTGNAADRDEAAAEYERICASEYLGASQAEVLHVSPEKGIKHLHG